MLINFKSSHMLHIHIAQWQYYGFIYFNFQTLRSREDKNSGLTLDVNQLQVLSHASQPYSTPGNIMVLYILIFKLLEVEKTKVFGLNNNMNFVL